MLLDLRSDDGFMQKGLSRFVTHAAWLISLRREHIFELHTLFKWPLSCFKMGGHWKTQTIFLHSQVTSSTATTCGQTSICFLPLVITVAVSCQRGILMHTHSEWWKMQVTVIFGWKKCCSILLWQEKCTQSLQKHGLMQGDQPSSELTLQLYLDLHSLYLCPTSCSCCAMPAGWGRNLIM